MEINSYIIMEDDVVYPAQMVINGWRAKQIMEQVKRGNCKE